MADKITFDITPTPTSGTDGHIYVSAGISADKTIIAAGPANTTNISHHEIPYGFDKTFPAGSIISIINHGKEIGQVPADELAAALKGGNGSILENYAEALLNGETKKDFKSFASKNEGAYATLNSTQRAAIDGWIAQYPSMRATKEIDINNPDVLNKLKNSLASEFNDPNQVPAQELMMQRIDAFMKGPNHHEKNGAILLGKGDWGSLSFEYQDVLNAAAEKLKLSQVTQDGQFGAETGLITAKMQYALKASPDQVVGPETIRALAKVLDYQGKLSNDVAADIRSLDKFVTEQRANAAGTNISH